MSGFARGIQPGARVRQGMVIGYIGNTGLSTGPHLHYEVIVNDRYVDPLRIRIPRGRELDGRMLAEFNRERERIDGLRQKAPTATRSAALARPLSFQARAAAEVVHHLDRILDAFPALSLSSGPVYGAATCTCGWSRSSEPFSEGASPHALAGRPCRRVSRR